MGDPNIVNVSLNVPAHVWSNLCTLAESAGTSPGALAIEGMTARANATAPIDAEFADIDTSGVSSDVSTVPEDVSNEGESAGDVVDVLEKRSLRKRAA